MKQNIRIHKAEPNKGVLNFSHLLDAPAGKKTGVCLGVKVAEDECYLLASGCVIDFCSLDPTNSYLDILDFEEGFFENGRWCVTRRLNGDEAAVAKQEDVKLLRLKVHIFS